DYSSCFSQRYDLIIFAVPSKELSKLVNEISKYINYSVNIINTSKGMKDENNYWCDYFLKLNKNFKYSYLSGPSFAEEVIKKEKTICNLCSNNISNFLLINSIFNSNYFKLVYLKQVKPYEFIGSAKNAIALCFGIINALTNSQNTIYALLSEFMLDLRKIIKKKINFSKKIDYLSYCSLGDIVMCSNSSKSRNFSYGYDFIKLSKEDLESKYNNMTIEGIRTLNFLKSIIDEYNLETKLFNLFANFINGYISVDELLNNLIN
ncbi:MAG: hypothetical protein K2I49_00405, partial [Ureaplasma sp.]|nr:hypothetical protein [Ureaplasma sp.]